MTESFEELLNQSFQEQASLEPGQQVDGRIVESGGENVFIHFGGKKEGIIPLEEFNALEETPENGQRVQAFYVGDQDGDMLFTCHPGLGEINADILRYLHQNNQPVWGRVTEKIKGGYTVSVAGQNAFCPGSQISMKRQEDDHIGKTYKFTINEFQPRRRFTVSRRQILEEEHSRVIEEMSGKLAVGQTVRVRVLTLKPFGAIVAFQGLEGLIPMSELSHHKLKDASEAVAVGDEVDAEILKLDFENNKISLSRKNVMRDPWLDNINFNEGDILEVPVSSIKKFGVFCNLAPGVDGLVAGAETGFPKQTHFETKFEVGQKIRVMVLRIDRGQKRISLSLRRAKENADRMELEKYIQSQNDANPGGGQSLGDLLKESL